jgi:hypothetical protein
MTPRNLVEELGRRLNTNLALDDAGLARIMVDGTLPVDFELDEAGGRLLIYAVIGIPPASGPRLERFMESLLAANLFGSETGPCSPAFDRERQEMLLWFDLGEESHIETAMAALENLVAQAERWRSELADAQARNGKTPPPADVPAGIAGLMRA